MFVQLAGRKTLFLSYPASFATIGVKAQAACTIYLKCMTVRIIAMSNPLELQRVPVFLFFFFGCNDDCQGDKQAVTMPRVRRSSEGEFKYLFSKILVFQVVT